MPPTPVVPCQSTCTPWCTPADVCEPCSGLVIGAGLLLDSIQAASDILFELSGRRFPGSCQDTVRPLPRQLSTDHGRPIRPPWQYGYASGYYGPYMSGSVWQGYTCNRTEDAGCTALPQVDLGVYPLTSIVQVMVDGKVADPTTYEIQDNKHLVRLADPTSTNNPGWPCCARLDLPNTAVGTWEVTMTYGMGPPIAGLRAAAELGCQLALACTPSAEGTCRLPKRVTQIARQGVTAVVLDPYSFFESGKTGLYLCDLFLSAVNPEAIQRRASMTSVDLPKRVRRRTV